MKNSLKAILALVLAFAFVLGVSFFSADHELKASEDDGSETADVQQEEYHEEPRIEVEVPVQEAPKVVEPVVEEPKVEEPIIETPVEESVTPASEVSEIVDSTEETPEEPDSEMEETSEVTEEEVIEEEIEEEVIEEVPAPEASVTVKVETKGDIFYGDTVKLRAEVFGAEGDYSIQWQFNDGNGWQDIAGANSTKYSFVVTADNVSYDYRAVVNY